LCAWTEESPYLEEVNEKFLTSYPIMRRHALNKSIDELRSLYFGSLEGVATSGEVTFLLSAAQEFFDCINGLDTISLDARFRQKLARSHQ